MRMISKRVKPDQFYRITLELEPINSAEGADWMSSLKKLRGIWENNPEREIEMQACYPQRRWP